MALLLLDLALQLGQIALSFFAGFLARLPDRLFDFGGGLRGVLGESLLVGEVAHGFGVGISIDAPRLIAGVQGLQVLPETRIDAGILGVDAVHNGGEFVDGGFPTIQGSKKGSDFLAPIIHRISSILRCFLRRCRGLGCSSGCSRPNIRPDLKDTILKFLKFLSRSLSVTLH